MLVTKESIMNETFKDADNRVSSKRIVGTCVIGAGVGLLLAVGITSIFRAVVDSTTALSAGKALVYTGGALLGVGIAEKFAGKK
jgi:membrane protein DedA with SNARE-associated domain